MSIESYDKLNYLTEFSFIAGSDKLLTFNCYEEDTFSPLNITNGSARWVLSPYGEFDVVVLEKVGTINTAYGFTVQLNAEDTIGLSGKYVQQITVLDSSGNTFKPGQGSIIILSGIPIT